MVTYGQVDWRTVKLFGTLYRKDITNTPTVQRFHSDGNLNINIHAVEAVAYPNYSKPCQLAPNTTISYAIKLIRCIV